tara:strand:+ start:7520 stop:7639 length:120 start_codon:yes stop_codon:yes gene_type:complete
MKALVLVVTKIPIIKNVYKFFIKILYLKLKENKLINNVD